MKKLILALSALNLIGCGHATTEMDRELALKLADQAPVVVASQPAPTINIYNGGQTQAPQQAAPVDNRQNCMESPVYNMQGQFTHYKKRCFGVK